MRRQECSRCLGTGEEFDGEIMNLCTICEGLGTVELGMDNEDNEIIEDHDRFIPYDDTVDYGEDINTRDFDIDGIDS